MTYTLFRIDNIRIEKCGTVKPATDFVLNVEKPHKFYGLIFICQCLMPAFLCAVFIFLKDINFSQNFTKTRSPTSVGCKSEQ